MSKAPKRKIPEKGGTTPSFEFELSRLEQLVARFEKGDLGLEQALEAFEQGIQLTRALMGRLDEAEKRIEILLEKSGGGFEKRSVSDEELDEASGRRSSSRKDEDEEETDEDEEE